MRNASRSDREKFVALVQQHAGGDPQKRYSFAQRLMRYGATYGRLQEEQCNGPDYDSVPRGWYPANMAAEEIKADQDSRMNRIRDTWQRAQDAIPAKESKIEAAVSELCSKFDCKAIFSGDPRGNTLKIEVKSGYSNSWGGEGICVPTS